MSTGNKIEPEIDFASAPGEMPLSLSRTYNHFWAGAGVFGKHWVSNLDYKLTFGTTALDACYPRPGGGTCSIGTNTIIYSWRPDGRTIKYVKNLTDGVFYESKPSPVSKIVKQPDGSFVLYGEDNLLEAYSAAGYILTVKNAQNIGWTFLYAGTYPSRVTHASGRYITLTWMNSQLAGIRDPAGNYYGYAFTANQFGAGLHRLESASRPGAPATTITYHYEKTSDVSALTGRSINGMRASTFAYRPDGKAISSEHNGKEKFTFSYLPILSGDPTSTEVINPLGKKTVYQFEGGRLTSVTGYPSTYCPNTTSVLTEYDGNGFPAMRSDANGNVTAYSYNDKGQLLQMIEAYGTPVARTTQYTWDTTQNRVLTSTAVGHSKKTYTYTSGNRIESIAETNLLAPSPANNLNQVRTTTFSYTLHPNGMLNTETIDGPLPGTGDAQVTRYDSLGNLLSITNGLGHVTTYSLHNALGYPGRVKGPNGDIRDYVYDARGHIAAERRLVSGVWQTTNYYYNALGRLTGVRHPDGHWQMAQFDTAGRKVVEYYPEAGGAYAQTRYTYNDASLVTRIDAERVSGASLEGPPPQAASTLTSPASNATGTYSVSWTAIAGTTLYQLEESANGAGWAVVQSAAGTSRAVVGKGNGTYDYRVAPCTPSGCGPYSTTATTNVAIPAPSTPPTLTVPAGSTGSYTVSWTSVAGATSYQLDENTNGIWTQVYSSSGTSLSRSKMTGDYGYRVRACNSSGCSVFSAEKWLYVEKEVIDPCPSCFMAPSSEETLSSGATEGQGEGA